MKPLLMAGLFLSFSLLLPVDSFASDAAVKQGAVPTPGTIRCIECISVNVSVWQFKPSDLKAQNDMLISLSKLQSSPVFYGQGSTGGTTVIFPGSGQTFIDKIDHLGSLQRRVDWKAVTRSEHPLPLAISSLAGNYSAVLTINDWRQFWRPQPFPDWFVYPSVLMLRQKIILRLWPARDRYLSVMGVRSSTCSPYLMAVISSGLFRLITPDRP